MAALIEYAWANAFSESWNVDLPDHTGTIPRCAETYQQPSPESGLGRRRHRSCAACRILDALKPYDMPHVGRFENNVVDVPHEPYRQASVTVRSHSILDSRCTGIDTSHSEQIQMIELTPRERFLQSLARCTDDVRFIPSFYDCFLSTSEEIRDKFKHTHFEQQHQMLHQSLKLAASAATDEPESLQELRARAETHDRYHHNIEPKLYAIWLNCVIDTARDFDKEWDESIEAAWKAILGHVIAHMSRHY